MRYFDEGYGVRKNPRLPDASNVLIEVTDSHRNWYGDTHGACFMTLSASSSQRLCAPSSVGVNYTFNFMRPAPLHSVLYASSDVLHEGRTMSTVETQVYCQGRTACRAVADYCNATKLLQGEGGAWNLESRNRPPAAQAELYSQSLDKPDLDVEALVCGKRMKGEISAMGRMERFAIAMPTNGAFSNRAGFIDAGAYCDLGDIALGIIARSLVGKSPTTQFSLYLARPARPGSRLVCEASIKAVNGRFALVGGTIWADDCVSAIVCGSYYSMGE
jgi:acyl-coenzyme A thioesterase PaaI-like protein